MKKPLAKFSERFAHHVVHRPWMILAGVIVLSLFFFIFAQNVDTITVDNSDALPDGNPVIDSFEVIESKFGSTDTAQIVFQIESESPHGVNDLRNPDVLSSMLLMGNLALQSDNVESVQSAATLLLLFNNGVLPKSDYEVKNIMNEHPYTFSSYISDDYALAIISFTLASSYDELELIDELSSVVTQVSTPLGVSATIGGEVLAMGSVTSMIAKDMGKTSLFSLLGILLVLLVLLRSVKYTALPLVTIGLGVLWTFGLLGVLGINLSSMTSGVISMIMGIGIDFGIQIVSRFRQELRTHTLEKSIATTINAVFIPMTMTTLSAIIGFRAMGLGNLTFLAEMGEIMSFGVLGCYLAALLIIPATLVLFEQRKQKLFLENN